MVKTSLLLKRQKVSHKKSNMDELLDRGFQMTKGKKHYVRNPPLIVKKNLKTLNLISQTVSRNGQKGTRTVCLELNQRFRFVSY